MQAHRERAASDLDGKPGSRPGESWRLARAWCGQGGLLLPASPPLPCGPAEPGRLERCRCSCCCEEACRLPEALPSLPADQPASGSALAAYNGTHNKSETHQRGQLSEAEGHSSLHMSLLV